jgi:cyclopropane fatty-acyl-phospholipid synthase-like methyltransferase
MYAGSPDPWSLADRWYEQRKYTLTTASLPQRRYRSAFEPGCSIGVLTTQLAARCDRLLAWDVVPSAVEAAKARTAHLPDVTVEFGAVPDEWPPGLFDLIVISELGYYLDAERLDRLVERAVTGLDLEGELVVAHWRHPVADYPRQGDDVHRAFDAHPALARLARHEEADFLLDVHAYAPARSVAAREGLC